MSSARFAAAAALALGWLAGAGMLTACTGSGPPTAGSQSAAHARSGPTRVAQFVPHSSAPAMPSPSATAPQVPATAPPAAAARACATGDLRLSVGPANGAAGSIYYPLLFTNTSGAACTMYGYPGVALVSQPGGSVVGAPAVRNPTFPKHVVTLAPGAIAHASLQVAVAANYPASQCKPATAHWLQVFPPGSYTALYAGFTAQTCTGHVGDGSTLGIYVVRTGATGP